MTVANTAVWYIGEWVRVDPKSFHHEEKFFLFILSV